MAVFNAVLISAICYPYISIETKFVHSAVSIRFLWVVGDVPLQQALDLSGTNELNTGLLSVDTENQAKSPFLFLVEKLPRADSELLCERPRA